MLQSHTKPRCVDHVVNEGLHAPWFCMTLQHRCVESVFCPSDVWKPREPILPGESHLVLEHVFRMVRDGGVEGEETQGERIQQFHTIAPTQLAWQDMAGLTASLPQSILSKVVSSASTSFQAWPVQKIMFFSFSSTHCFLTSRRFLLRVSGNLWFTPSERWMET